MKVKKHIPILLSPADVATLINAVSDLKYQTLLMTIYSGGLRINEAVHLQAQDIPIILLPAAQD